MTSTNRNSPPPKIKNGGVSEKECFLIVNSSSGSSSICHFFDVFLKNLRKLYAIPEKNPCPETNNVAPMIIRNKDVMVAELINASIVHESYLTIMKKSVVRIAIIAATP